MTDKTSSPVASSGRRARRFRITGVIVLVIGVASAVAVYWTRSPDLSGDVSMLGYDKPERQQMGILYGKQGQLLEDLTNDLKQPGTQAVLIIGTAMLAAAGCFFFARLLDYDAEHTDEIDSHRI